MLNMLLTVFQDQSYGSWLCSTVFIGVMLHFRKWRVNSIWRTWLTWWW